MRHRLFLSALLPLIVLGCPSETPAVCDNGACDPSPDGSTTDGSSSGDGGPDGTVPIPEGCDPNADPKDAPKCVVSDFGVFVDATTGNDGNSGSKELPVKSITGALAKLNGRPRIYVCEGTYPESVKLTSPISIYGGFACGSWAPSDSRPKIAPANGVPLTIANSPAPIIVQQVEAVATADPTVTGDSAVAAIIVMANEVTLRRVALTAGDGVDGNAGASVTNWSDPAKKGTNALDGGNAVVCTCVNATTSTGGSGGPVGAGGMKGDSVPAVGTPNGGLGGDDCTVGGAGANGAANAAGTASSRTGTLSASGWSGSGDATPGQTGNPAQGGGGGGGKNGAGAGGGGGCGGCGGGGGTAGGNGGSSVALAVFNSRVTIDGGVVATGAGGIGGRGGEGQAGQAGGGSGAGACNGGVGGSGAGGSGGGGGAGGHSAPVVYVGTPPQVIGGALLTPGPFGSGGAGGPAGAGPGNAGNAGGKGPDGKAVDLLPL